MNVTHRLHREQLLSKRRIRREIRAQLRRACMDVVERRERRAALRAFNGHVLASELRTQPTA
jgi:hypothetical protein